MSKKILVDYTIVGGERWTILLMRKSVPKKTNVQTIQIQYNSTEIFYKKILNII